MGMYLNLRRRTEIFPNSNQVQIIETEKSFKTNEIAVLVIGMWSSHACQVATDQLDALAPKVDSFLKKCRNSGSKIIFGSSSLTKSPAYKENVAHMKGVPFASLQDHGMPPYPPLPIDDSDGGIVTKNPSFKRSDVAMHPGVTVLPEDAMSDNNKEILNFLHHHGIKLVLVCGVHLNMCVLDRPYGIKNLMRFGFPTCLVRDLTDPMYNPKEGGPATRAEATEKVVQYVERYFCPSVHSEDIMLIKPGKKFIRVDVDDTVCLPDATVPGDHIYKCKSPVPEKIEALNRLYDEGHCIVYWTARGIDSGKDWTEFTRAQLKSWGAKSSGVVTGKKRFDIFFDDKAYNEKELKLIDSLI